MRVRHPSSILQLLLLAALAALLVPPHTASYSIISARGLRPLLSADTALVTAAIVLNVVLFLIYGLVFDVGRRRDAVKGLDRLFATTPTPSWLVGTGRLAANIAFGTAVIAVSGLLLMSTLYARYGSLPSLVAAGLFLATCLPIVCLAAVAGMFVDLVLPRSPALRSGTMFAFWMALVLLSALGIVDLLGMNDLRWLIGHPTLTDSLSIGFISGGDQQGFIWRDLPAGALRRIPARFVDIAIILGAGALVLLAAARNLHRVQSDAPGLDAPSRHAAAPVDMVLPAAPPPSRTTGGSTVPREAGTASPLQAMRLLLTRLFRRSRWASAALITGLALGLSGAAEPGFAIAVVYLVPLLLLARTSPAEVRVAAELESCEAALARPGPALFVALSILAGMLAAALPAIVQLAPLQALTAIFGLTAVTAWLVWAYRVGDMPILGVAVAGGVGYLVVFNEVPAAADILGLWQQSATACALAGALAALLVIGLHRARPA